MGRTVPRAVIMLVIAAAAAPFMTAEQPAPGLTPAEVKDGWRPLFDGRSLAGWQPYRSGSTAGWKAADSVLSREGKGGDIVTVDRFTDFELRLEWRLEKAGNSGIFFHVTDEGDYAWHSGPEFQILDNGGHADGKNPLTSAGSNYAVHPPVRDVTRPLGQWNSIRLLVRGTHVEHWMNDVKLLEYELWSPDWEARVKASKFGKIPPYGRAKSGRIGLQDHGDPVWFRNIRVKAF
jgi:Domain of Unknown Function (DUF1080)